MPDNDIKEQPKRSDEEIIADSPFGVEAITIERNGVSEKLIPLVGARGAWKERPYAAPQFDDNDKPIKEDHAFIKFLEWVGKSNAVIMLNTWLRRCGQDYVENATGKAGTPDEGVFNLDRFKDCFQKLTAAGQKISEMEEQLQKEQDAFTKYVTGDFIQLVATSTREEVDELKLKVEARRSRIANIKFMLEQRRASYSQDKNTDEVRPN